jgi:hypothetical protein
VRTRSGGIEAGRTNPRGGWVYVGGRAGNNPASAEKAAVTSACERFIVEVLKPRFLAEIRPTKFNYPIDIYGKWHGNKYRFITRYRSDDRCSYTPEFEAAFARLEYISRDRFDLSWHRHTGEWFCLFESLSLTEALQLIESTPHFAPC